MCCVIVSVLKNRTTNSKYKTSFCFDSFSPPWMPFIVDNHYAENNMNLRIKTEVVTAAKYGCKVYLIE